MKRLISFVFGMSVTVILIGQIPESFNYQAVLRDAFGNIRSNAGVDIDIAILQGSTTGTQVFTETHNISTNEFGLVNLEIGSINTSGFAAIDWANGPYFVRISVDGTEMGASQLLSVPYALHAKKAESTSGFITYSVGDFAQGGIVFWVDETGQHGLVCAIEDQNGGNSIQWFNGSSVSTEAFGNGIYAGEMNTMLIIANLGSISTDYAAGVCASYSVAQNGILFGDWYLPSSQELRMMYANKDIIDNTASTNSGSALSENSYWSSTQDSGNGVWIIGFTEVGTIGKGNDQSTARVRAIRAF